MLICNCSFNYLMCSIRFEHTDHLSLELICNAFASILAPMSPMALPLISSLVRDELLPRALRTIVRSLLSLESARDREVRGWGREDRGGTQSRDQWGEEREKGGFRLGYIKRTEIFTTFNIQYTIHSIESPLGFSCKVVPKFLEDTRMRHPKMSLKVLLFKWSLILGTTLKKHHLSSIFCILDLFWLLPLHCKSAQVDQTTINKCESRTVHGFHTVPSVLRYLWQNSEQRSWSLHMFLLTIRR